MVFVLRLLRLSDLQFKGITITRESRKKLLGLTLLVGIGAYGLNVVSGFIGSGKQTTMVTVTSNLQAGTVLQPKDLKDVKIKGSAPPDILTSDKDAVGLSLALPVKAGTPLVKGLVAKEPLRDGLYPGEVGVWIGVNLTSAGLVNPGDLVDVEVQYDPNKNTPVQQVQSFPEFKGVRVVNVVNGSAQPTKGQTGGNSVPAAVEVAIPKSLSSEFVQAAAGKLVLLSDPFATPLSHNPAVQGTVNTQSQLGLNNGIPVTTVTPGTNTVQSNKTSSPTATSSVQNTPPQNQNGMGTNSYVPPTFNPGNTNNQGK